jgi:cysteinyl-tRNA synthetase
VRITVATWNFPIAHCKNLQWHFRRIENFVERAAAIVGDVELTSSAINSDFATAMNEDLNVPAALAVLHEVVGEGNYVTS